MKIKSRLFIAIILANLLTVFFVVSPLLAKDSIRIGFSMSLTGIYSQGAVSQMNSYKLWKEMVNEKGGIYVKDIGKKLPVEFVFYDDKSSADTSVKVYEKLITRDKVDLVLTPWGTIMHFAIAPLSEKYKIPMIGSTASSVKLRQLNFKYLWFVTPSLPDRQMKALSGLLKDQGIKSAAIIYVQDLYPRENLDFLKPMLKKANIKVIYEKDYPIGVKDLTTTLADIKAKNPDALLALTYPADAFLLTGQIQGAQLNPKLLFMLIGPTIAAYGNAFGAATEGICSMGDWSPSLDFPGVKAFNERYIKTFNIRPDNLDSIEAFVECQILEQAIEKAGTIDRANIRDAIASNEFMTLRGPVRFEGTENTISPAGILQYQKGGLELVWPPEIATAKAVCPKPAWSK
ncbi:MAG: amino acid ABC transporter substrate-binding protein [Deltaproteobacteria bacterium]|nr:amino acid ABC transporter substrate-binding protein [Deltaproteobacteria bacterium]